MLLEYTAKCDFITSCGLLWNVHIPRKRGVTFKMAVNLTLTTVNHSTPCFKLIKFIITQTLFDWNVILQYLPKPCVSPLSPKISTGETMLRDFNYFWVYESSLSVSNLCDGRLLTNRLFIFSSNQTTSTSSEKSDIKHTWMTSPICKDVITVPSLKDRYKSTYESFDAEMLSSLQLKFCMWHYHPVRARACVCVYACVCVCVSVKRQFTNIFICLFIYLSIYLFICK